MWTQRNHGDDAYKNYLSRFQARVEEDIPKLLIFDENKVLIDAIQSCSYDKKNPEDVAGFDGDDPYDGIRYLVDEADHYFLEAVDEFEKVQARQEIVNQFEQDKDWNRLYQKARLLESNNSSSFRPARRYRH
jgi:hypothetical protein